MTRKIGLAIIGCLFALPAHGESALRGQWTISVPAQPDYTGTVLVDADSRVTYSAPADRGRPAKFRGYVARVDHLMAEFILTDGAQVARVHCLIQSSDLMHCHNRRSDETVGDVYLLTRLSRGTPNLWQGPRQ